ncbi:Uncharacterized protein Fot_27758 [Forsythia ovata]|uniref:Uncharacterized protein n=1 Tax=Forsythia ovata TaxID=205694 RepID=A0ABD1TM43_9LAMI
MRQTYEGGSPSSQGSVRNLMPPQHEVPEKRNNKFERSDSILHDQHSCSGASAGRSTGEHIDGSGNFSAIGAFMNPFFRLNHSHTNLSLEEGPVKSLRTYGTKSKAGNRVQFSQPNCQSSRKQHLKTEN